MHILAVQVFNEVIHCLKNSSDECGDLEEFISGLVNSFIYEYKPQVTEWTSNYHKEGEGGTTSADTIFFGDRRIVIAYKYLHEHAQYCQLVVALMKDYPKPNLSIRKAIFLYDAGLQHFIQVQDEMPEL